MMGKIVGPKGSVVIFEPYSVSYKIVTKNLQINGASSYSKVYKYGAGEKEETLTLWVNDVNTGGTSFASDSNSRGQPEEVEVKPVDSVIGDKHIDFILMDVEMFELPAMNGMRNLLKRSPALTFLLEWNYLNNPNRNESRTKELLDWLALEGFKWYRYLSQGPCKLGSLQLLNIE
jgi:FkbM family methyltransferase